MVDLSHLIRPDMPVFPGTEQPKIERAASLEKDGFVEHRVTMYTHTGTHIDVPSHITSDGPTVDQMEIGHFIGKAAVIDVSGIKPGEISREALTPHAGLISRIEYLILKTGWGKYWGAQKYFEGFPSLGKDAAEWLCGFKLKGIGVDAISIDPIDSKNFPVHKIFFKNGIVIVENLANLDEVGGKIFMFYCMPLKFQNGGGSPVRAVGII